MQAQCGCCLRTSEIRASPSLPGRFLSTSMQPKFSRCRTSVASSALETLVTRSPCLGRTRCRTCTTLSYGEVALRAGKPGGARAVVAALHRLDDIPWWRVARHDGTLAPQVARQQAALLRQEGWKPRRRTAKRG